MEPLEKQLATKKLELKNFESAVASKKNELVSLEKKIEDANNNIRQEKYNCSFS